MESDRTDDNNTQAMLNAFQAHNQTYFEYMNVSFPEVSTDAIDFSQSG